MDTLKVENEAVKNRKIYFSHSYHNHSLLLVLSLAPRGFSPGTPVFLSSQKPKFQNSNSTRNQVDEEPLCGCASSKSLFIYLRCYNSYLHTMGIIIKGL